MTTETKSDVLAAARKRWPTVYIHEQSDRGRNDAYAVRRAHPKAMQVIETLACADTLAELLAKIEETT